jgi:hypothetical protein
MVIPFSIYKAKKFATRLTRVVNEMFPKVELRVAIRAPNTKDNFKDPYAM